MEAILHRIEVTTNLLSKLRQRVGTDQENWSQIQNILDGIGAESEENPFGHNPGSMILARNGYNTTMVKHLMELGNDPSIHESETLREVAKYGNVELIEILLADSRIDPLACRDALYEAAKRGALDIVYTLLGDERISNASDILYRGLEGAIEGNRLEISSIILEKIINRGSTQVTELLLQKILSSSDYNICHFDMLLREIVLKRRDLEYYLDWMIEYLKRPSTSQEVRDLISNVTGSILLSEKKIIHTSPLFTAYSGFFLLAEETDIGMILNSLEEQEGVTNEGLVLAGTIIAVFLRRKDDLI